MASTVLPSLGEEWVKSDFQLSDAKVSILSDHSRDITSCLDRMSANSNQLTEHDLEGTKIVI